MIMIKSMNFFPYLQNYTPKVLGNNRRIDILKSTKLFTFTESANSNISFIGYTYNTNFILKWGV